MSAKTDRLLAQYRVYETLIRNAGQDPKAVEDSMEEERGNQMRMVRQFRNFLAHNEVPGFLEPTDKMLKFLDKEVLLLQIQGDTIRKHLRTPAAAVCEEKETCAAGIEKLAKMKQEKLVVHTKAGTYELCDIYALASLVAASKSAKICVAPRLKEKPLFMPPTVLFSDVETDRVIICTQDGTEKGKLLGVVKQLNH